MSKIKGSSLAGTGTNERIDNDFYATWFVWEHGYQGEPIIRWL